MACTFFYCFMHDDGFTIQGKHAYVPEGYAMKHSDTCELCDWRNMGVIQYNASNLQVIEEVTVNYDRYGGGFVFRCYLSTLTDEKGNTIEDKVLDEWIEDIANNNLLTTF
jgi:hypothetical protein